MLFPMSRYFDNHFKGFIKKSLMAYEKITAYPGIRVFWLICDHKGLPNPFIAEKLVETISGTVTNGHFIITQSIYVIYTFSNMTSNCFEYFISFTVEVLVILIKRGHDRLRWITRKCNDRANIYTKYTLYNQSWYISIKYGIPEN